MPKMMPLEPTHVLLEKLNAFLDSKRKRKIQEYFKRKNLKIKGPCDYQFLLYRSVLQDMVDNFENDNHVIWNLLDDYLKGNKI